MRIIIDIGHPAHVHLFKNLAIKLKKQGHIFYFTVREGENESLLLKKYNLKFSFIGRKRKRPLGKLTGLLFFSLKIIQIALSYKPDLFLSHGSVYAGIAAFFLRKPHIAMEDTGNMEQIRLSKPVSDMIITSEYLKLTLGSKQVRYKGFHELAYLHPDYFNPVAMGNDFSNKKNKLILIRFSSWNASHDLNIKGFSLDFKRSLIERLSEFGDIYISSEGHLPDEFKNYQLNISPDQLHHFLTNLTLYVGEGATTASECAMLGVPAIYYNPKKHDVIEAQEKYGLLFHFNQFNGIMEKAIEILNMENSSDYFNDRRQFLLKNHINLTNFLEWVILNYPQSHEILKNTPGFANQFK